MRQTLAGLTIRGRAFLTAGITAIVCAVVLGQPSLARAGALVTALPLASAFMLARHKYRLSLRRTLSPPVVSAGCAATVTVTVTNEGQRTSGTLMLEDTLPYPLGSRPRFLLEGVDGGWSGELSYQVRSEARGRFDVGPMTVRVADPFGLIDVGRSFRAVSTLTVTPRTVPLPPTAVNGAFTGSGDNRPRAFAAGNAEDVTVREYRRGDELRRVHWASSAHAGQLMVRREEQQWHSRATIFLDNRVISHRGSGIASSLEAAVSVAASVGVHLADRGFAVRLVSAAGEEAGAGWHFRES